MEIWREASKDILRRLGAKRRKKYCGDSARSGEKHVVEVPARSAERNVVEVRREAPKEML